MKYSLNLGAFIAVLFVCLALISSCGASQKLMGATDASSEEYLVQFMEGTSKERVESLLSRHGVSRFTYVTSSRARGYVVLMTLEAGGEAVVTSLEQEKRVKNVDSNFTRSIDRE